MTITNKDEGKLTGSFAGLRVLDFSTTIAGPHCTRMLADMGAEVIKIETDEGETMRTRLPVRNGCSTAFGQLNVGKNSVVLDLKSAQGIEAVRRLVATSDVLVENFRPGVMRRLKLDYASLRDLNPKLIYCSISGYGQTGPSAELPAYAPVIHAASGYEMAHLAYQPGRSRPDYCGIYHADVLTGVYAFGAISAASVSAQRAQAGPAYRRVDAGIDAEPDAERSAVVAVRGASRASVRCSDRSRPRDGYVMVAVASEKTFQSLLQVIGHPEWIDDPRFAKYADRRANWGDLMEAVEAWSRTVTTQQCLAALNATACRRGLSHGEGGAWPIPRSPIAARSPGRGWRRHLQVLNLPFRMSGVSGFGGAEDGDAGRAHPRLSEGNRSFRRRDRGLLPEAGQGGAALTSTLVKFKS